MEGQSSTAKGSFAAGLMAMDTRGACVNPVRLTNRAKEILLLMIEEDKSATSTMFDELDDVGLGLFLSTMIWIEERVSPVKKKSVRFNLNIAYQLWSWVLDKTYHHLSNEPDFEIAMQWITNQWNSRYALNDMIKKYDKFNIYGKPKRN